MDTLGSVQQTTDITGTVTANREWTPFGVDMDGAQAGLGYTGEWWDDGMGLLYLRARWYDARTGRFTQRDPWEGALLSCLGIHCSNSLSGVFEYSHKPLCNGSTFRQYPP